MNTKASFFLRPGIGACVGLLAVWVGVVSAAVPREKDPSKVELEFFEKSVRPIFIEHCYSCHSKTAEKIKGGFVLDSRDAILKGGDGGPVIVPGKPDSSRLITAIRHTDDDLKMPPKTPLSPEQIAKIEAWVLSGAPYPKTSASGISAGPRSLEETRKQWPFTPLKAVAAPKVRKKDWPRTQTDALVLSRLEAVGISPSPRAGALELLRRLSFDLNGLPPAVEDIRAVESGGSEVVFERLVDKMLDSQRFGETWARHWLDVARYSDSNGLESNLNYNEAWRYRDYVVQAFNRDKPYDQFIREQLAGDLMPSDKLEEQLERLTATGLLMLGPKQLAEPDREKLAMDVVDEQIDITMRAFQGVTVSCARCHDHKFDPIPSRDYYALAGIFTSTRTMRENAQPGPAAPATTPWIERPLDSKDKMEVVEAYDRKVAELATTIRTARQQKFYLPGGVSSNELAGIVVDNPQATVRGSWKSSIYSTNRFVQKDYLQDGDREKGAKSVHFRPMLPAGGRYEVRVAYPAAPNRATNVPVTVDHKEGSVRILIDQRAIPPIEDLFISLGVFTFEAGTNAGVTISTEGTRGFVVADAVQFLPREGEAMMMAGSAKKQVPVETEAGMKVPAGTNPDALQDQLNELQEKAPPRPAMAMAVQEGRIANTKVRIRGDVKRSGEEVPRGIPAILLPRGVSPPEIPAWESGRRQLADWIASTNNPLTARVAVNRIWMHLFGRPLAGTPDNFGSLGERPQQPELLDHLAVRFMQLGWSHKKFIREIVLGRAYQMSSAPSREGLAIDSDNQWLWRMPVRRLKAEAIRDAILQSSGTLNLTVGGPALSSDLQGANPVRSMAMSGTNSSDRRSIYLPIRRNDLDDLLQNFDFADPHALSAKRNNTSAPTQALFMLNSDFLHEKSLALAKSLESSRSDSERLETLFLRTFSRRPGSEEAARSLAFVEKFAAMLGDPGSAEGDRRRQAWRALAHAMFASTEFRFLN